MLKYEPFETLVVNFRVKVDKSGEITFMCTQKLGKSPALSAKMLGTLPEVHTFVRALREVTRYGNRLKTPQVPSTNLFVRPSYKHL